MDKIQGRETAGRRRRGALLILVAGLFTLANAALAAGPRVLPEGKLPDDRRLGSLKDLDGYFPFTPSKTPEQWNQRAERVRRQVLVACGIWPMPEKTPLRPIVYGKVDRDDYTVEKVILESWPGFYVTGNLYRPKDHKGPLPAVLCPHGHWSNGRFHDHGAAGVQREIAQGAEKFEVGGRHPIQARCVQLARMGCLVFQYDMLGYADSVQLPQALVHGFRKQRPELDKPDRWGLFGPQAELRLQSVFGLQTYNSIRAVDWIASLPEVDPKRIAVTGSSGGGTQTFILCAIDPRPAVAFPAVMVSTAMQGGCTCENACYLRVGTGNIELAALIAPRPLGMSAANDWTQKLETKGLPELRQHYAMLGVPKLVAGRHFDFGHNYNATSRAMMYEWLNQHLKLGQKSPIEERDYKPLAVEEMSVWTDEYPKPTGGEAFEVKLTKQLEAASQKQIDALAPKDPVSLDKFRKVVGGAVDVMIGREVPAKGTIEVKRIGEQDRGKYLEFTYLLRNKEQGEETPTVFLMPKQRGDEVVVWIDPQGKSGLYGDDGRPIAPVRRLLEAGKTVVGADLLYQGEFLADGKPLEKLRTVDNPREYLGYTLGYNHPLFSQRVHDILGVVSYIANHNEKPKSIHLVGANGAGHWLAAAVAQIKRQGDAIPLGKVAIDTAGFRFAGISDVFDPDMLPGAVKYGDLPALLALAAGQPLRLAGEKGKPPQVVVDAWRAAGAGDKLAADTSDGKESMSRTVDWLLEE